MFTDIVRLKKTVQIFQHYNAKDNIEMSVREGQIIAVTEADDEMYHGPNGWFPKTHASEVASLGDFLKHFTISYSNNHCLIYKLLPKLF